MSETIRDDLDAVIDGTVREMLAVEPDATFDARVHAVATRAARASFAWRGLAAAAACTILAAAILPGVLRWFGPPPGPDAPHVPGGAIEATRTEPPVWDPPDLTVDAGASQGVAARAANRKRTDVGRAPERQPQDSDTPRAPGVHTGARGHAAAPITGAEPLTVVAPLPPIEPLTIASLPRETASLQARLIVPLEPIAAIEIPPLSPSEWRE